MLPAMSLSMNESLCISLAVWAGCKCTPSRFSYKHLETALLLHLLFDQNTYFQKRNETCIKIYGSSLSCTYFSVLQPT